MNKLVTLSALTAGAIFTARRVARSSRSISFAGRTVIITGGSRGLGLLLARRFAAEGARLAICSRNQVELDAASEELSKSADVHAEVCDVSIEQDVHRLIRNVASRFGGIDVLINNAGTIMVGPMETMQPADYDENMRIHFYGPMNMTLAALPSMRTRDTARIVNISSIGGLIPVPHLLPYTASKFALTGFSLGLREELLKDNIYVTTVFPGLIRTGSPRNAWFKGKHELEYAWFKLGDSLPLVSQNADRAARYIVEACRHGDAKLVTSVPACLAAKLYVLFPAMMTDLYALANYLLPAPGGIGPQRAKGFESESTFTKSPLMALTEQAAQRNNETNPTSL
jgi:NAD(P)-dependent dehydrogenase (short-subunit alcohol dehydrogenase family)